MTDFCTGEVITETAAFLENFPATEGMKLTVCSDADPPNPPANCQAYFQYQQATVDPYIIKFFDVSSTAALVESWFWDFGDGATSTMADPSHLYETAGDYLVTLAIQADTCESTYTSLVQIRDTIACDCNGIFSPVCVTLPSGEVLYFLNECFAQCDGYTADQYDICGINCDYDFDAVQTSVPGLVQFRDKTRVVGTEITEWFWDFGDGGSSFQQNPLYPFRNGGMYDVGLRILTTGGCAGTLYQPVFASGGNNQEVCQAMFYLEQDEGDPLSFTFEDLSFASTDSWLWDFGDGNSSTEQNPTHAYAQPGEYLVSLTAFDGSCSSTMYMNIPVDVNIRYGQDCRALFLPVQTGGLSYAFLDQSFIPEATYEWRLGDGATSTAKSPNHIYTAPGTYDVSLSLTTEGGCNSTFSVTVDPASGTFTGYPPFSVVSGTAQAPAERAGGLKAYPNPAGAEVTLSLDVWQAGRYNLALRHANGQALRQLSFDLSPGQQQIPISLAGMPSGLIFLQVQGDNWVETLRIIRQ
ncbi:MAG: PKD domain-containing protein [Phaeodactylibacter sp.]|nr:PKD domain-containing protein [Phaeodactylibacter sp.]MCB9291590.1 PKD domain-containing protein [Lewinellaceae bacterium]